MSDDETFQRLCQARIEGRATEAEDKELAALLRQSDTARRSYVEQMRIHAMLTWQHGRSQAALPEVERPLNIVAGPWRRRALMSAAAAVLFFAGLITWRQAYPSRGGVAIEVIAAAGVPFQPGARVNCRNLDFERGALSFRLASGAVVRAEGATRIELVTPMHLRLLRGSVTADMSEGLKGFVIETAQARIVDLGTQFGVKAGDSDHTDVAVFQGKVEVYDGPGNPAAHQPKVTLNEGEAIRLGASRPTRRLQMIHLGKDSDTLINERGFDLVAGVEDNVTAGEFRGYYGLVRGGMGEGARVYTTGASRRWHAMPGESFPDELAGADVICTFSDDRRVEDLKVTVSLTRPCDLFVMADARVPAPAWLSQGFTDTGLKLRAGPRIPRGTPPDQAKPYYADETAYVPYSVWKKRVDGPGTVELGSPSAKARGIRLAMYGIAVKERN